MKFESLWRTSFKEFIGLPNNITSNILDKLLEDPKKQIDHM